MATYEYVLAFSFNCVLKQKGLYVNWLLLHLGCITFIAIMLLTLKFLNSIIDLLIKYLQVEAKRKTGMFLHGTKRSLFWKLFREQPFHDVKEQYNFNKFSWHSELQDPSFFCCAVWKKNLHHLARKTQLLQIFSPDSHLCLSLVHTKPTCCLISQHWHWLANSESKLLTRASTPPSPAVEAPVW